MLTLIKRILVLICVLIFVCPPVYAQNELLTLQVTPLLNKDRLNFVDYAGIFMTPPPPPSLQEMFVIVDYKAIFYAPVFSSTPLRGGANFAQPYRKGEQGFLDFQDKKFRETMFRKNNEKRIIREAWEEWLGVDIWYPYFKAKEIEDWVCDKVKIKIFSFRGRLKFENKQVTYTLKMRF